MGHVSTEPKYLLIFFISTLHKELNKAPMKFINKNINLDKRNKQLMFQLFTEDFINSNWLSDLFYGVNCNIFHCFNSNSISYEYQTYSFFDFPLEEIKLNKNQILNNNNNNNITDFSPNNNSNEINI